MNYCTLLQGIIVLILYNCNLAIHCKYIYILPYLVYKVLCTLYIIMILWWHYTVWHYVTSHLTLKASLQGHRHPCPCDGLHLDHWAVCSGRGGEGLCLPLCHCQCVSGEEALANGIQIPQVALYKQQLTIKLRKTMKWDQSLVHACDARQCNASAVELYTIHYTLCCVCIYNIYIYCNNNISNE